MPFSQNQNPPPILSAGLTLRNGVAVWAEPLRHTVEIQIPASQKGSIIGKQGEYINYLRKESGANVKVNYSDGEALAIIEIKGKKDEVEACQEIIKKKLEEIGTPSSMWDMKLIDIPKEYVKDTMGPGGKNMLTMSAMSECRVKFVMATELDEEAPLRKQIACIRGPADKIRIAEHMLFDKVAEVKQQVDGWGAGGWGTEAGQEMQVQQLQHMQLQEQQAQQQAALEAMMNAAGPFGAMMNSIDVNEWPELMGIDPSAGAAGSMAVGEAIAAAAAQLGIGFPNMLAMQQAQAPAQAPKPKNAGTVPCKFEMRKEGSCKNAATCNFSHDIDMIEAAKLSNPAIMSGDLAATNPAYKKSFCKYWESGRCARAENCEFAHGIEELRGEMTARNIEIMAQSQAKSFVEQQAMIERENIQAVSFESFTANLASGIMPSGNRVCIHFQKTGQCKNGDDCFFPHIQSNEVNSAGFAYGDGFKAKTQLCKYYQARGFCKNGDKCTFAHGEHELAGYEGPDMFGGAVPRHMMTGQAPQRVGVLGGMGLPSGVSLG